MILVDINILIYAAANNSPKQPSARTWLDGQFSAGVRVGLPWHVLLGFVRITTNPRFAANASSAQAAWNQICAWLENDGVWIPQPTSRHQDIFARLLREADIRGDLVSDAHLATLAIEHGLTLCSTDRDFARFPGLRWTDPLKP